MCGIAGFWGFPADEAGLRRIAKDMGEAIRHRGPDGNGERVLHDVGLGLAHRRLAIIDLTEAGFQPMDSHSGRWTIVFNGEIYNYQDVRRRIESARGEVAWRGHSDTEVLLEAIELWGVEKALTSLDGMFAFAAWDRGSQRLVLARDRLGEKPLYYGVMPDGTLLFASELRALYVHPSWRGDLNRDAVALLMHYNAIPAPYSVFERIGKLPPAHWVEVEHRVPGLPRAYWQLADVMQSGERSRLGDVGNANSWLDQLEATLGEVIEQEMISDVPLGAFLSGGIDSSLVVAMMQKRSPRPVKTFTIGFKEGEFDEAIYAKEVAKHLGTEHHELYLTGQDSLDIVPHLADIYDEPFSDSSQIPTSLVSRFAREHVTVALSGDAGDELFAGYSRYHIGDGFWQKIKGVPYPLRRLASAGISAVPTGLWDSVAGVMGPLCPKPLRASPGEKFGRVASMMKERTPVGFYGELLTHWRDPSAIVPGCHLPRLAEAERTAEHAKSDIEYMQAHDTLAYLPNDILVKVDRAAMAFSLETRAPFVDRRLLEFAWRVPMALKAKDGSGKWIMRELLARHLPRRLFERPKQGFAVPIVHWLRGPLREWAEPLLSEESLSASGLFDPVPIRRKWREHLSGDATWHYHLWDVLMFQAWYQRHKTAIA